MATMRRDTDIAASKLSAVSCVSAYPSSAVTYHATNCDLPGWKHVRSGKVRDLYIPEDDTVDSAKRLLLVASDRISAYDFILPTPIPDKGAILTQMSRWWFQQLAPLVDSHIMSEADAAIPQVVRDRAVICHNLQMYPIECVVRGYLTGSGLVDYQETGQVCGHRLPAGLVEASRLEQPIFTPAAKANVGEHDENITFDQVAQRIGRSDAERLRDVSIAVYERARDIAARCGIILADTKFEFGYLPDSAGDVLATLVLGDEVLTPDSSRFWPADQWVEGRVTPSFDKQYVRDWLTSAESGWDRHSGEEPPELPDEVVEQTRARYIEAFEMLAGTKFQTAGSSVSTNNPTSAKTATPAKQADQSMEPVETLTPFENTNSQLKG
ncbi:MAG: phosphoribosylaminoimidazolesuccinocarboxamide synthase [Actinomycetaceae bacterium]|nr:phosphoribosylaminoimidazolesuccinocarboxamide synthase [Actinomycetaceae bacterium]